MKTLLTKEEKIAIYQEVVDKMIAMKWREFVNLDIGVCGLLYSTLYKAIENKKVHIKMPIKGLEYEGITWLYFPEFDRYKKGEEYWYYPFWFPMTYYGYRKRLQVLRKIIFNLKNNIK